MKIEPGMWIKTKFGDGMIYNVYKGDPKYHSGQIVDVADIMYDRSIIFDVELASILKHDKVIDKKEINPASKRKKITNLLDGNFPEHFLEEL